MFDICIPSWNSLSYLKLCVKGLRLSSNFLSHKIYVHDNGSTDGTTDWCKAQGIPVSRTEHNVGFSGVNHAIKAGKQPYVAVYNTDMWPLPGWDLPLLSQIHAFKRHRVDAFTLSCCLVEPQGNNPEYDIINFGVSYEDFNHTALHADYRSRRAFYLRRPDTVQYSHPIIMPRKMLEMIGYFDTQYFPGWAVDHDLAASAYFKAGCREFRMLGKSRVYHFSSKTFSKLPTHIRAQHGHDIFERKWNMSVETFRKLIGVTNVIDAP